MQKGKNLDAQRLYKGMWVGTRTGRTGIQLLFPYSFLKC